jgi:tetratricopeptide (TPR) repeat protein
MIAQGVGPALAQPYWDEYMAARQLAQLQSPTLLADADVQRQWIALLENAVRRQPTHARAHLALAESHCRLFDALQADSVNQMPLASVRDATIQSRFASREALTAWLSRAVGPHWTHLEQALNQTRRAVRLCPLQGRGYVYLANLTFLGGADAAARGAYVDQALRVRPFDGSVLYAAGSEALLAGDAARWLDYAKRAFRCGRNSQRQFLTDMVGCSATEDLPAMVDFIIREFDPDLQGLRLLHAACAKRCQPNQMTPLLRRWAERAQAEAGKLSGREAAGVWLEAQQLHRQLGDDADALQCARKAAQCDPGSYPIHYQLALSLLKGQVFDEAETHLRWCLQRTPSDPNVQQRLREALKGRLDGQRRADAERQNLR